MASSASSASSVPAATPARAILLMVAAMAVLTLNDSIAKWLTQRVPVGEVMAVRGALVVAFAVAWAAARGRLRDLRVHRWRPHLLRGALMASSTFLFVTSLSLMPIADAIAISFAGPIFGTVLGALVLRERVGWRRWTAVAVGFAGVLVMVRPTPETVRMVALVPLAAALIGAFRDVVTRRMGTGGESTLAILVLSTAVVAVAGLLTLPFGWVVPDWPEIGLFAVTAVLVGVAQGLMIESLRHGEVGLVGPFKYTSLVWAVLLGALVWGDLPGPWTWAGSAIVIASGLYIWRREASLARRPRQG
ncbi:membrane protein [Thalassobaculum fulvum]|uniref:Membrane protein n=1 Tax=Thalassobaculum fulvum TaxID=1633335 RepID=A0A918XR11_9PROT|nr:DMT family transporter [Thalassobaculum fulvum]GHD48411.1 membrane protein [Thalassobaculum fulvum]